MNLDLFLTFTANKCDMWMIWMVIGDIWNLSRNTSRLHAGNQMANHGLYAKQCIYLFRICVCVICFSGYWITYDAYYKLPAITRHGVYRIPCGKVKWNYVVLSLLCAYCLCQTVPSKHMWQWGDINAESGPSVSSNQPWITATAGGNSG